MYLLLKMKIKHHLKKHPWDETLVIAVMIISVMCILLLLADHLNVLGKAYSTLPTSTGFLNMMNSCQMVSGDAGQGTGTWERGTNCNIVCANYGETNVLAWKGTSFQLINGKDKIGSQTSKENYHCLCCSPDRIEP